MKNKINNNFLRSSSAVEEYGRDTYFLPISIANALKITYPDADILFVGAENRNGNGTCACCRLPPIKGCR